MSDSTVDVCPSTSLFIKIMCICGKIEQQLKLTIGFQKLFVMLLAVPLYDNF